MPMRKIGSLEFVIGTGTGQGFLESVDISNRRGYEIL